MTSVATIPTPFGGFTGCLCAVRRGGEEIRLATYRGVRIERWDARAVRLRQGPYRFEAELLARAAGGAHLLQAPSFGAMRRVIGERLAVPVHVRVTRGGRLLADFVDEGASFEAAGLSPLEQGISQQQRIQ